MTTPAGVISRRQWFVWSVTMMLPFDGMKVIPRGPLKRASAPVPSVVPATFVLEPTKDATVPLFGISAAPPTTMETDVAEIALEETTEASPGAPQPSTLE